MTMMKPKAASLVYCSFDYGDILHDLDGADGKCRDRAGKIIASSPVWTRI